MKSFQNKVKTQNIFKVPVLICAALFSAFMTAESCTARTADTALKKLTVEDRLEQGKITFNNSCAKCHDLPEPTDYNASDWVGIMNAMAPKAKLSEDQHESVYDYIVSQTKNK